MKKKKTIMTCGGVYDNIDNFYELPDEWNGNRWFFWKESNSTDEKEVKKIFNCIKKYNILDALTCIVIPKTFTAKLNGKLTTYPKGGRLLTDRNRRFKSIKMAKQNGYEIVTPDGQTDKLPYIDQTTAIEDALGKLGDMDTHGKSIIFRILQILNKDQVEFSDESVIIGGAECVTESEDNKVFVYMRDKLKEFTNKKKKGTLTPKLVLMSIMGRNKLKGSERENIKIDYDMDKQEKSNFNLKMAQRIKIKLGGKAPAPFIETFLGLVFDWMKVGYFKYVQKTPFTGTNKKNEPMTHWEVTDECDNDLFEISKSSVEDWKEQYESIVNYITEDGEKKDEKQSGEKAVAKRAIQWKIKEIYDEYKTK